MYEILSETGISYCLSCQEIERSQSFSILSLGHQRSQIMSSKWKKDLKDKRSKENGNKISKRRSGKLGLHSNRRHARSVDMLPNVIQTDTAAIRALPKQPLQREMLASKSPSTDYTRNSARVSNFQAGQRTASIKESPHLSEQLSHINLQESYNQGAQTRQTMNLLDTRESTFAEAVKEPKQYQVQNLSDEARSRATRVSSHGSALNSKSLNQNTIEVKGQNSTFDDSFYESQSYQTGRNSQKVAFTAEQNKALVQENVAAITTDSLKPLIKQDQSESTTSRALTNSNGINTKGKEMSIRSIIA